MAVSALVVISCVGILSDGAPTVETAEAGLVEEPVLVCQVECTGLGSRSLWYDHVGIERRLVQTEARVLLALGNALEHGVLGCEGKNESDHGYLRDMNMAEGRRLAGQEAVVAHSERPAEEVEAPRENDVHR